MTETATNTDRVWMSYKQAADYTGLDRVTLWRAVKRAELRAGGTGRVVRFERSELDRFMRGAELASGEEVSHVKQ